MPPGEGEEPPFTRRVSSEERDDTGGRDVTRRGCRSSNPSASGRRRDPEASLTTGSSK